MVDLAVAGDLDLEPIGKRVHALGAHTMETAGEFIRTLAELAARVQIRQHELDGRHLELRVHVDRDAASVILDGTRPIRMQRHVDAGAISRQVFVDRIVEHLKNAVVQASLIRGSDVHSGALSHTSQALEFVDFGSVVFLAVRRKIRSSDIYGRVLAGRKPV